MGVLFIVIIGFGLEANNMPYYHLLLFQSVRYWWFYTLISTNYL